MARRSAAYGAAPRQAKTVKQLLIKRCRQCGRRAGCRKIFLAFRRGEVFFTSRPESISRLPFSGLPGSTRPLMKVLNKHEVTCRLIDP